MPTSSLLAGAAAAGAAALQPPTLANVAIPGVNTTTTTKTTTPSTSTPTSAPSTPYFMTTAQPAPIVGSSSDIRAGITAAQNSINSTKTYLQSSGVLPGTAAIPTGTSYATTPTGNPTTPTGNPTTPTGATTTPTPFIPNQTKQPTVNAADLMAGRVDANGNPIAQTTSSIDEPAQDPALSGLQKQFDTLTKLASDPNLSADEQARVDAAANAVKAQYDVLIAKAQRQAELGKADALVTAGERGGFLNTQLAGTAALTPTVGRNFVGEGGKLYEISSGYDATIAQLQAEQINAIQQAREAETQAIRTGRQDKWKQAMDLYNAAADMVTKKTQLQKDKVQALKDSLAAKNDDARLALDYEKYQDEKAEKRLNNATTLAKTLAPQLVDLDAEGNVVAADFETIADFADQAGVDADILAGSVAAYTDNLRKTSLDERRFVFDQNKFQSDNILDQKRLQLEERKFAQQTRRDNFDMALKESEMQQEAAGYGLNGSQLQDAVKKGYKSKSDLALYASQVRQGVTPAILKEKSAEQMKLEANVASGLDSLSTIKYKLENSVRTGKFLDGEYKFAEANLIDVLGRLRSGGAITEDEEKRFQGLLPSTFRLEKTNKENLDRLKSLLINAMGGAEAYEDQQQRVYSNVRMFTQFADYGDREEFDKFFRDAQKKDPSLNLDDPDESAAVFDQFKQKKGFNQPLSMGKKGSDTTSMLGDLSKKYESSGNPGAIGYDSTGGWSYGTYQLAHNNAQRFVQQSPYAEDFAGITFNSDAFRNKWKEVAKRDPEGFAGAQEDFIAKTHYEPLAAKAAKAGLDLSEHSPVLAQVIFSTGVQHGANTDVVNRAIKKVGPDADDATLIKAIYQERWGGGSQFANSTPQVRQAVKNRFFGPQGELATALKKLSTTA